MACSVAHSEHWRLQRKLKADHINALRRARRAENPQISTAKWFTKHLDEILELYGPNCHICNTPIDLKAPRRVGIAGWERSFHPDHVVPLSKGGQNVIENIRPAHAKCNMRKAATLTGAIQGETTESEVIEPSEPSNP
jgi:5-methylcytosine-specific restriction endonuclease McrA